MKTFRKFPLIILLLSLILMFPLGVGASPENGFSIFLQAGDLKITDMTTQENYGNLQGGGGLDYQWALSKSLSITAFLSEISGSVNFPALPEVGYAKISHLGGQARLWLGKMFLGLHTGIYFFTSAASTSSFDTSNGYTSVGGLFGIETKRGLFATIQNDCIKDVQVENGPLVHVDGFRFSLGYRWK